VGVTEHGLHDLFWHATLTQDRRTGLRVLFEGGVDLPVKVMQQPGHTPDFSVLAVHGGVMAHGRLYTEHVAHQPLVLYMFVHNGKRFVSSGHWSAFQYAGFILLQFRHGLSIWNCRGAD